MPRHGRVAGRSSTRSGATPWQRWSSREPAQWEGHFRACAGCGLFSIPYEALAADAGLVAFARNVRSDALVDASPRGSGCRALRLSGQPRPNSGASNGETDRDDLAIFALTLSAQRPLGNGSTTPTSGTTGSRRSAMACTCPPATSGAAICKNWEHDLRQGGSAESTLAVGPARRRM